MGKALVKEKKNKVRTVISAALTVLWMAVIFLMSANTAEASTEMSIAVGRTFCNLFVSGYDDMTSEEQIMMAEDRDHPLRKAAHMAEYAVLGALVITTLDSMKKPLKHRYFAAFAVSALYASTDEFHQYFVPGRSAEIKDVAIDCAGVLVGILLYLLITRIIREVKKRRKHPVPEDA